MIAEDDFEPTCAAGQALIAGLFGFFAGLVASLAYPHTSLPTALVMSIGIAFGKSAADVSHPGLLSKILFLKVFG
jgi:hypothetical protein